MKTVLIGLLQGLSGWLVIAALLSWALQQHGLRPTDTIGIALFGGAFVWAAVGLFASAAGRWRERAMILGGASCTPPADGRQITLVGTIEPTGPALKAPLDGSACVMYSYEIVNDSGTGKQRFVTNVARGVALAPCRIVTQSGVYKLLVVPEIQAEVPRISNKECINHFQQYARSTTFTKGEESAQELLDRWRDDDGAYRSDVAFVPPGSAETNNWVTRQQHVPVGAGVCVFGLYSQAKRGIIPCAATPTRLICGSVDEVAARLRSQVVTRSSIATLLIALIVMVYLMNR